MLKPITRVPTSIIEANQDFMELCSSPLDFERMAQYSFADYHVKGLTYINLQFHPELIIKLYSIPPTCPRTPEDFLVGPHDHAYDFSTFVLSGSIEHWTFDWAQEPYTSWNRFRYTTAERKFELMGRGCIWQSSHSLIQAGGWYHLDATTIHTIAPGPSGALLLLYQKPDRREQTRFYSKSTVPPDTTGLYRRMSPETIKKVLWDGAMP